jgi:hypothetical protein
MVMLHSYISLPEGNIRRTEINSIKLWCSKNPSWLLHGFVPREWQQCEETTSASLGTAEST